ncbi:MAG: hypothetical protein JSW33_01410 [bacterium]|nr:MAG: hypothetical protein JSW33_01410 [bacterium]
MKIRIFLIVCLATLSAFGQRIPKNDYTRFLPIKHPPLVRQAQGSAEVLLFGDKNAPDYQDVNPRDGIDDRRAENLMEIALRFSPILVQNSFGVPMDFRKFTEHGASYLLYVDEWNLAGDTPELMQSYTIDILNLEKVTSNKSGEVKPELEISDDQKLLSLLKQFNPDNPSEMSYRKAAIEPLLKLHKVMYIDFPGGDLESWKTEYVNQYTGDLKQNYRDYIKIFVHPFINRVETSTAGFLGYELVMQYYFFYPFNDGANKHIGDWEHLNVVVNPLNKVDQLLNREEIENILDGNWDKDEGENQLVIKRYEAYFHHNVFTLDYSSPNTYLPREQWEQDIKKRQERMIDEKKLWRKIRQLAYQDKQETRINTHPIAYIGGDSKGPDLLMVSPGGRNRDSHGTYPLPGIYKKVGPGGASEQIAVHFDHQKYFQNTNPDKYETYKRGGILTFNSTSRLEIIPDWEQIIDFVHQTPEMRKRWYWMLLPMHWGYPAVESPLAGLIPHADTGNLAPEGPWYQGGWNRSGPTRGQSPYDPHSYYLFLPISFTDTFQNNFGFLNLTLPTFVHIPPLDITWTVVSAPFRAFSKKQNPVFYPSDAIPFRFFSLMPGVSKIYLPDDFGDLLINERQGTEVIAQLLLHYLIYANDETEIRNATEKVESPTAFAVDGTIQKDRFSVVNTLIHSQSEMTYSVFFNNIPDFIIRTQLNMWQYEGSIRFNVSTRAVQPYLRVGYGYTWYRLENTTANEGSFIESRSNWFNKPFTSGNYFPNTFVAGLGLEWIFIKSMGKLPKGIDISAKLEYTWKWHKLGLKVSEFAIEDLLEIGYLAGELPQNKTVRQGMVKGGLVFSF